MATGPVSSLWQEVSPARGVDPVLAGEHHADVGIVGGGLTGLSTALHLARRGCKVSLVEGRSVGWGGSGRNNGQVIPTLAGCEPARLEATYGKAGERLVGLVQDSAEYLFRLAESEGIDCEAEQSGWFQPAHSLEHLRLSEARVKAWTERSASTWMLDRLACVALLGSEDWFGGMFNPTGGHINPLMLTRGLANASERAGAEIFENSPVQDISQTGAGWQIKTPTGSLHCDKVLLATNAYSGELSKTLVPEVARSIMPVLTWQMATEPLNEAKRASIVPGREAVSDTRGDLRYFRYDARNRLIAGGGLIVPVNAQSRIRKLVSDRLTGAFPQLGTPHFNHTWSGHIGVTTDHLPHFHQLGPGFYTAVGYNGRGVALSVSLGREFAALLDGVDEGELALPWTEPRPIRAHAIARRLARSALLYYRWRDTKPPKL